MDNDVDRFVAEGNVFEGEAVGKMSLTWRGSGNILRIGPGVKLLGVKFRLRDGGTIDIGEGCTLRGAVQADGGCVVAVGPRTTMNRVCSLRASESTSITIGKGCLFSNVRIQTSDLHAIFDGETGARLNEARDIRIGNRVWLGEDALVYKGADIGSGSIIGARAFVSKKVPKKVLAVGVPAKVIRTNVRWSRTLTKPSAESSEAPNED